MGASHIPSHARYGSLLDLWEAGFGIVAAIFALAIIPRLRFSRLTSVLVLLLIPLSQYAFDYSSNASLATVTYPGYRFTELLLMGGWVDSTYFWFPMEVLLIGTLVDMTVLAIVRRLLRKMMIETSLSSVGLLLLINSLLSTVLFAAIYIFTRKDGLLPRPLLALYESSRFIREAADVGATNLLAIFLTCSILLVTVLALVHRAFWPVLGHAVYAIYSRGTLGRYLLMIVGTALIGFGLPAMKPVLELLKSVER